MATTWTISTLERELSDGGVIVAHWRATDSETVGEGDDAVTYTASNYGTCGFTYDASSPDFTPYADLTESQVLGWCWADGVDQSAIEAALTANINDQKNPTTGDGVPW
jgi:hypothetical protein